MGTASAIPEHLYRYSDQCTQAAQELQDWVRTVLVPALHAYLAGAAHQQSGANVDIGAVSSRAGSVEGELPRRIAAAYYTDRRVRTVGKLFEEAGGSGVALNPGDPLARPLFPVFPDPHQLVKTTDEALDQQATRDGAALARMLPVYGQAGGDSAAEYWRQLAQRADDPLFCAGYYNALTRDQLEKLPWNSATTQALATAYASGHLTRETQVSLAYAIMNRNNTGEVPTALFQALAANPQGAANFARYLLSDHEALHYFLGAKGWGDWYPGFHPPGSQAQFLNGLLQVFQAAASVMDQTEAQEFAKAVGTNLPRMDLKDAQAIEQQLQTFLGVLANRVVPRLEPVPGEPYQETLQKWAARYGSALESLLQPFESWLNGVYQDNKVYLQHMHAFVENVVLGAIGVGLTAKLAGTAIIVAGNGLYGGAAGEAQGLAETLLPWSTPPDGPAQNPRNLLHKSAIFVVVAAACRQGLVGPDGKPVTLADLKSNPRYAPGFQALLQQTEQGGDAKPDDTDWALRLHFKDGGNLAAVLDAMRSHFDSRPLPTNGG